jgi:hypothetical protein
MTHSCVALVCRVAGGSTVKPKPQIESMLGTFLTELWCINFPSLREKNIYTKRSGEVKGCLRKQERGAGEAKRKTKEFSNPNMPGDDHAEPARGQRTNHRAYLVRCVIVSQDAPRISVAGQQIMLPLEGDADSTHMEGRT